MPEEFITYFQSTYIGIFRGRGPNRKRSTPPFPVDMWLVNATVLSPDIIPRSNNSHEAFNKSMTNSIPRIHPNIWLLITHLKKEEILAQMKRTHYERGDIKTPRNKDTTINDRLQHVVSRYDPDDKIAFLKSIALNLHSFWRLWSINVIHVINLSFQDDKIDMLKSIAPNIFSFWMCQISINFFCVCLSFSRILLYWFWTFMQLMFFYDTCCCNA